MLKTRQILKAYVLDILTTTPIIIMSLLMFIYECTISNTENSR